jgi:NACHT domain
MSLNTSIGAALPKVTALDAAAVKAVRNSLPGKLLGRTAAILAGAVLVLGFAELAKTRMVNLGLVLSPEWLNPVLLVGLPILVIAVQLLNEWHARRNRRRAVELAIKPALVPEGYFRIGPYLDSENDRAAFVRADQAHEKVLEWLRQSSSVPLYLTGDSGSGKTSLLNAFVIPVFRKDGWTVTVVRAGQDAEAALNNTLAAPRRQSVSTTRELIEVAARRCRDRLLIVLDQFEEFLILGAPDRQGALATMLADLSERPVKGLKILLVVRSDYQTAPDEMGLPRLLQGENFFQVGRFREESARIFFRKSKLGLKDEPLERLLKSAAELDDTPGMIRPITLNVLGYVLRQRGGAVAPSLDAGALVHSYITQAVENPAIRVWSLPVLEGLLTEQGTKRPRRETELAAAAKLRTAEVRAVLHALAGAALARPLEATQDVWGIIARFRRSRREPLSRAAALRPAATCGGLCCTDSSCAWRRDWIGGIRMASPRARPDQSRTG